MRLRSLVYVAAGLAVGYGALYAVGHHGSSVHRDQNAIEACRNMQAGVAVPAEAGHDFDIAAGLARAADTDDSSYAGFAGRVEIADGLVQQALSRIPTNTQSFNTVMTQLQADCHDVGVDLGITSSAGG